MGMGIGFRVTRVGQKHHCRCGFVSDDLSSYRYSFVSFAYSERGPLHYFVWTYSMHSNTRRDGSALISPELVFLFLLLFLSPF